MPTHPTDGQRLDMLQQAGRALTASTDRRSAVTAASWLLTKMVQLKIVLQGC